MISWIFILLFLFLFYFFYFYFTFFYFSSCSTPIIAVLEEAIVRLRQIVQPDQHGVPFAGAEWWVQVVDGNQQGSIGFHLDKDESIASLKHYLVHPTFGSILYLTGYGGCTLIFNQYSPTGWIYIDILLYYYIISVKVLISINFLLFLLIDWLHCLYRFIVFLKKILLLSLTCIN